MTSIEKGTNSSIKNVLLVSTVLASATVGSINHAYANDPAHEKPQQRIVSDGTDAISEHRANFDAFDGSSAQANYLENSYVEDIMGHNLSADKIALCNDLIDSCLSEDHQSLDEDVNGMSFYYALKFIFEMSNDIPVPSFDLHPDGELSLLWRSREKGIFSLAFSERGVINYSAILLPNETKHKGQISFNDLKFKHLDGKSTEADTILFTLAKRFG